MPIKASAEKELRKNKKRVIVNARVAATIDRLVRQARKAVAGKSAEAAALLKAIQKTVDKAVAHGIVKQNTAGRIKSRLAKRFAATK